MRRAGGIVIGLGLFGCGAKTGLLLPDPVDAHVDTLTTDAPDTSIVEDDGDTADVQDTYEAPDVADTHAEIFEDAPELQKLDGLRWELPCLDDEDPSICVCASRVQKSVTVAGPSGARYRVSMRFRGVVEEKTYTGGTNDGAHWQVDGMWDGSDWNLYSLDISSPLQRYFLNRGTSGRYVCVPIDYTKDVEVDVGATVLLDAISIDAREIRNIDGASKPIVIPGVPPAPKAFDGQFIQMDVVAFVRIL